MTLTPPDVQVAEAREAFCCWWEREGLADLVRLLGDRLDIRELCQASYLQGQIDGGGSALRLLGQAAADRLQIEACVFCGAPLPPAPEPGDPVVRALGRLCADCRLAQDQARDLLE